MIWLFRRFRNVSFIDQAIAIWADGDRHIGELTAVADALHAEVTGGKGDPGTKPCCPGSTTSTRS
jgi:hypothetical protein